MQSIPIVSQTLVEYGTIAAALAGIQQRVEGYVGTGNLKYVVLATLSIIVVLWVRAKFR